MGSRSYAQVAPTPETMAMNAYIFMYGGHSLVTPHTALKQLWWTDELINAKITRSYIVSKLRPQERSFLHRPLAFGEGLTDDTYLDWILDRAKRLFIILVEIGVPDQIFGCIDNSWTDDDLPLQLEDIENLELAYENDDVLNKKFYQAQFQYLLRQLEQGSHIDYGPKEHIPMEHVQTMPPAVSLQTYDRVHFPGRPDNVFMRRKFSLIEKETGKSQRDRFMHDIRHAKSLNHEHIAPLWASYTSDNAGYSVSNFVPEHTLATFMEHRTPPQFIRLSTADRKVVLCEWMHCLADALAFLHNRGTTHAAVRPSNIWIDESNRIAFADIGSIRTLQKGKRSPKTEAYDYAAPETLPKKRESSAFLRARSPPAANAHTFSKGQRHSASSSNAAESGNNDISIVRSSSSYAVSTFEDVAASITPLTPTYDRSNSFHFPASQTAKNFSRVRPASPPTPSTVSAISSSFHNLSASFSMTNPPEASIDIFSLGCIYLDLLTFLLKGKLTDFIKYRSAPVSAPKQPKSAGKTLPAPVAPSDTKGDTSYHASLVLSPTKLTTWLELLRDEAEQQISQVHASSARNSNSSKKHSAKASSAAADAHTTSHILYSVSPLLTLVARMLAPVPALRPTALEVRGTVLAVLRGEHELGAAGIGRALCCEEREWDSAMGDFAFELENESHRGRTSQEEQQQQQRGSSESGTASRRRSRLLSALLRGDGRRDSKGVAREQLRGSKAEPTARLDGYCVEEEQEEEEEREEEVEMREDDEEWQPENRGDGDGDVDVEHIRRRSMVETQANGAMSDAASVRSRKTMPNMKVAVWKRAFLRAR